MNEHLRDRILRKLETLSDERGYQVLDYVEFLESRYAERQSPTANDVHAVHRRHRGQAARRQGLGERHRRDGRLHEPRGERVEQRARDGQEHGERAREHRRGRATPPTQPGAAAVDAVVGVVDRRTTPKIQADREEKL